ncbi:hypothetical protein [Tenacibaculum piscium]|uniref:Lipoprotein n=1 Tax=Tenacibaculum piscium TaxID=1458515 RepID=A0A2H1YKB7_9FLAO|nr:hypothetical protein [Tenacibaculum piscium]MBE7629274.1 hypothetical protein [Tenacibaculum piscium]MBE7670061.1 hypothetical protein [Tenacibaculum piscium]MBE7690098.1 hypothetical protein [Tenacibaculum piscium]SOS75935.1 conserved exported hypothetical protein [Tenacibaculum piscium]
MKLVGILFLILFLTQCASVTSNDTLPFSIKKASYSLVNDSLYNSNLNLIIEFTSDKTVDFEKVYFKHKIMNPIIEHTMGKKYISAHSKTAINKAIKNLVLDVNPEKEYGNKILINKEKFPYQLKDNQAIIEYKIKNKNYIYKIENIHLKK